MAALLLQAVSKAGPSFICPASPPGGRPDHCLPPKGSFSGCPGSFFRRFHRDHDEQDIWIRASWFNYETVIQSLREFIDAKPCPEGQKYCVVLDNAPWHKKAIRLIWTEEQEEYADIREKIEYLSLPPYSPDLNPIEQVWRKTRREKTHNRYFGFISKLINVLDEYFAQFFMPNEQLKSLCSFSCFALH